MYIYIYTYMRMRISISPVSKPSLFHQAPKIRSAMALCGLLGLSFLARSLNAEWSGSSFSSGNFRVQSACSAWLDGELWTFGGRGGGQ